MKRVKIPRGSAGSAPSGRPGQNGWQNGWQIGWQIGWIDLTAARFATGQPAGYGASWQPVPAAGWVSSGQPLLMNDVAAAPARPVTAAAVTSATENTSSAAALGVPQAQAQYQAETGTALTGAGLKIGIISDSFALDSSQEQQEINNGLLPAAGNIHVLQEGPRGSADEGRAMALEIHAIAPGAQIYFYSGVYGDNGFATGINELVAAGCNVIVDDLTYSDEPFYQDTGVITKATEAAVAAGVNYFAAAGNNGADYYESQFNAMVYTLPGLGSEIVHDVSNGSPYEAVTLTANDPLLYFTMQWDQPFSGTGAGGTSGAQYDLGVGLFSKSGNTYTLVENFSTSAIGGDPELQVDTQLNVGAGTYYLAFYESGQNPSATSITLGEFKILFFEAGQAYVDGVGAGQGSGSSVGHQLAPGVNTVAAVNVADTPVNGVATPVAESFSAPGPGETYVNSAGTLLASPVTGNNPQFAATDGSPNDVFGTFTGTSAAAPNAAAVSLLMLQADPKLNTKQVTDILERSAISTGDSATAGAGLIQANVAVALAYTAATTPVWTGQAGNGAWNSAANWSDGSAPGDKSNVTFSDGFGLLKGAYSVAFAPSALTMTTLTVDGGTAALPDFRIGAGQVVAASTVTLGAGTIDLAGALVDTGGLAAGTAAGTIILESTGKLQISGSAAAEAIDFSGTGGTLELATGDATALLSGLNVIISGFAQGDTLDLAGLAPAAGERVVIDGSNVTIVNAASQALAHLHVSGAFSSLVVKADGSGGSVLTACFCEGTRILTPAGEVAVENLVEGGMVITSDGEDAPIKWIGRRRIDLGRHPQPERVQPVRIAAGALGEGVPSRDLFLSPDHALLLNGFLVPAKALVNGANIVQLNRRGVVYYHVELAAHSVIFAERAAVETYLETGNRAAFENAGPSVILHPDFAQPMREALGCAPFLERGVMVERLRDQALARARPPFGVVLHV
jgi:hypothetical protein